MNKKMKKKMKKRNRQKRQVNKEIKPNLNNINSPLASLDIYLNNPKTGLEEKITMTINQPQESAYLQQLKDRKESLKALRNADFKNIEDSDIIKHLTKILAYNNGKNANFTPMSISTHVIPPNTLLFRIRSFDSTIKTEDDLWYPPANRIKKLGRLNDINEPILYIAGDVGTALAEMRVNVGEEFYLLFYKVSSPINLVDISPSKGAYSQYPKVEEFVSNFLVDEFSTFVPETENERYRVSNIIGKYYFNYKNIGQDGWIYPSAVKSGKRSIAIDSQICKNKLKFLFVAKGRLETETDYSFEQPRILNKNDDKLYFLSELIKTEDINNYDTELINDIETIWNN